MPNRPQPQRSERNQPGKRLLDPDHTIDDAGARPMATVTRIVPIADKAERETEIMGIPNLDVHDIRVVSDADTLSRLRVHTHDPDGRFGFAARAGNLRVKACPKHRDIFGSMVDYWIPIPCNSRMVILVGGGTLQKMELILMVLPAAFEGGDLVVDAHLSEHPDHLMYSFLPTAASIEELTQKLSALYRYTRERHGYLVGDEARCADMLSPKLAFEATPERIARDLCALLLVTRSRDCGPRGRIEVEIDGGTRRLRFLDLSKSPPSGLTPPWTRPWIAICQKLFDHWAPRGLYEPLSFETASLLALDRQKELCVGLAPLLAQPRKLSFVVEDPSALETAGALADVERLMARIAEEDARLAADIRLILGS